MEKRARISPDFPLWKLKRRKKGKRMERAKGKKKGGKEKSQVIHVILFFIGFLIGERKNTRGEGGEGGEGRERSILIQFSLHHLFFRNIQQELGEKGKIRRRKRKGERGKEEGDCFLVIISIHLVLSCLLLVSWRKKGEL